MTLQPSLPPSGFGMGSLKKLGSNASDIGTQSKLAYNLQNRNWQSASLNTAIARHAGDNHATWITKSGKQIYEIFAHVFKPESTTLGRKDMGEALFNKNKSISYFGTGREGHSGQFHGTASDSTVFANWGYIFNWIKNN